jgi:phosphopantothenoylcysteine decarboxylase/phosphopantothenate--cysteine ligase
MTEAATHFIGTATMQALSGSRCGATCGTAAVNDAMGHIELSRDRELILVAPASADFMAKLAQGLCDDLLSTLCVARRCPLMVAPAMNVEMWQNAATQRNAATLRADGVQIVGPASGGQACGEMGMGPHDRARRHSGRRCSSFFFRQQKVTGQLRGKRVVVTAGTHRRTDRPGPRHHLHQLGEDGLRDRARGREAGAEVHADQRTGVAADAGRRGARRRAYRAADVRRG